MRRFEDLSSDRDARQGANADKHLSSGVVSSVRLDAAELPDADGRQAQVAAAEKAKYDGERGQDCCNVGDGLGSQPETEY